MKKRNKLSKEEIAWNTILYMIFSIPIIIFVLDTTNTISFFYPHIKNLTSTYDWLSFAGTYLGAIIGAVFLILVTSADRK